MSSDEYQASQHILALSLQLIIIQFTLIQKCPGFVRVISFSFLVLKVIPKREYSVTQIISKGYRAKIYCLVHIIIVNFVIINREAEQVTSPSDIINASIRVTRQSITIVDHCFY